jgi:hypothetical protein
LLKRGLLPAEQLLLLLVRLSRMDLGLLPPLRVLALLRPDAALHRLLLLQLLLRLLELLGGAAAPSSEPHSLLPHPCPAGSATSSCGLLACLNGLLLLLLLLHDTCCAASGCSCWPIADCGAAGAAASLGLTGGTAAACLGEPAALTRLLTLLKPLLLLW